MKKLLTLILILALALSLGTAAGAEGADISTLTVTSPSGAPALALATLAAENPERYTYVAADAIAGVFAKAESDFIIAPVNAGAKLFKAGKSTYKLAAVVTWGNLFIASQKADLTADSLNGADITLFGENTINASIVLYALKENGITPAKIEYLAGAAETQALLLSDENAIVVTAEPMLTAAKKQNDKINAIAVNELYQKVTGSDGYTQAALFVRAETMEKQPDAVKAFLAAAEEACAKCASDPAAVAEAAAKLEIKFPAAAIPGCAIRYVGALEAKEQVEKTAAVDLSQFGGEVPADDFYYGAQ